MPLPLAILGGGGHALIVLEAARLARLEVRGFFDDDPRATLVTAGLPCLGPLGQADASTPWILGLGDLKLRRTLIDRLGQEAAIALTTPGHPRGRDATIGPGVLVATGAIVQTRARIHAHAIINTGAIVEHECVVGENAHIAPGSILGGRVQIGADTLVGLGSRVLPNLRIGRGCIIGAGSVVTRDLPDGSRVAGVPARQI